jgi:hypothetical protein
MIDATGCQIYGLSTDTNGIGDTGWKVFVNEFRLMCRQLGELGDIEAINVLLHKSQ